MILVISPKIRRVIFHESYYANDSLYVNQRWTIRSINIPQLMAIADVDDDVIVSNNFFWEENRFILFACRWQFIFLVFVITTFIAWQYNILTI